MIQFAGLKSCKKAKSCLGHKKPGIIVEMAREEIGLPNDGSNGLGAKFAWIKPHK